MKLKPVSFTFKSNGKEGLGVIAQDLEKVYPQLVTKGEGMKSVNYEGLIGPLIGAVQELKNENDDLRQQLGAGMELRLSKKVSAEKLNKVMDFRKWLNEVKRCDEGLCAEREEYERIAKEK